MAATVNSLIGEISERVGDIELERVTKEQVIVLINAAARDLRGAGIVLPIDNETLETVAATYEYAVPATIAYIFELWLESAVANQYDRRILRNQWILRLVGTTPTLIFDSDLFTIVATRNIKIVGYQRPTDTYVIGTGNIDEGFEAFIRERATSYAARQLSESAEGQAQATLENIATATWQESVNLLAALAQQPDFLPRRHSRHVPLR